ncbi:NAD-dependent epimerase/dehydratase family protein [Streptomyces sp. NPDC004542]|uniref:NAD-dependent epimerase/dehydratase family protein n=1 Tax=Streptomyces sp. NPDC004542 TaxID=3154281 RepID=UPI0033B0FA1D
MTAARHAERPENPNAVTAPRTNALGQVLVVGGTGFIGSAVLRELLRSRRSPDDGPRPRVLSRGAQPTAGTDRIRHVVGDLTEPASLEGICSGVDTVVHAASYVGRDPQQCRAVNHMGTRALLDEARRQGVRHFVYVSTASVYGMGPQRGPREGQVRPAPVSPASTTRLRAEDEVRAEGGIVLRPHLVYGAGDRWFVPTLARLLRQVPSWPAPATARSSVIAVEDLARVVVALAGQPGGGETYHVADPRPLSMHRLCARMRVLLRLPEAQRISLEDHRSLVRSAMPELSDHQYALLTEDNWFDTDRVWRRTGLNPGPGFEDRFAACASWYARHLHAGVRRKQTGSPAGNGSTASARGRTAPARS